MKKQELAILERAMRAEIENALGESPFALIQTKSKLAIELENKGLLARVEVTTQGKYPVVVKGFVLTHLGRFAYCDSCRKIGEGDEKII